MLCKLVMGYILCTRGLIWLWHVFFKGPFLTSIFVICHSIIRVWSRRVEYLDNANINAPRRASQRFVSSHDRVFVVFWQRNKVFHMLNPQKTQEIAMTSLVRATPRSFTMVILLPWERNKIKQSLHNCKFKKVLKHSNEFHSIFFNLNDCDAPNITLR